MDLEFTDRASADFTDKAGTGDGEFVDAVEAMNNPGPCRAELDEGLSHGARPFGREDTEDLELRTGRIGQGAQQVEDRADAEFCADRCDMAHGAVMAAREQEGDTGAVEAVAELMLIGFEVHAERFEHIG